MHTDKELASIRKQMRERQIFNYRLLQMGEALSNWEEAENSPDRERLAFKAGFFEGFRAARMFYEQEPIVNTEGR